MTRTEADELLAAFPRARTQLLAMLLAAQGRDGYLSEAALSAIAHHAHVPQSEVFGVASSYSELRFAPREARAVTVCTGLSCLLAGARQLAASLAVGLPDGWAVEEYPCRFRCDAAPVAGIHGAYIDRATPEAVRAAVAAPDDLPSAERPTQPRRDSEVRRLLARRGLIDADSIGDALALGAYDGWRAAQSMSSEAIVDAVDAAGLIGRGGAYFPVAAKWRGARAHAAPRYLVVNAEEGEPGVFKDRYLVEGDPHLLVEGILIAARAIEVAAVYVYVNSEAALMAERIARAFDQARHAGLAADAPPVELRRGAGGYVCGEESVILNSIEGERAVPRLRPPFPVESGLWGRPTVINNVETLCNLPMILREGPDAFRAAGTAEHPGTKLVCLSGAVRAPGVYEVPFGTTLRHVFEVIGGGAPDGRTPDGPSGVKALLCGGPSGTLLPPAAWDAPLAPGRLDAHGASPGAGGIRDR